MATGVDRSMQFGEHLDDLLNCNICLETLKEPKLLPCLHTFCKSCIRTHIESSKQKKGEILCPICRFQVSSQGMQSSDDVESVIDIMPENTYVCTLLNNLTMTTRDRFCDSCTLNGIETKAISWCASCNEAYCDRCKICHNTFKATAGHDLISITDIGQNKNVSIPKYIFCDDHPKRAVEVYCVDHKKACCAICGTLSHRKCDKLISIEEATLGIKQKPKVSNLLKDMDEYLKLLADIIIRREENETNIETEARDIEIVVKNAILEMKNHLDKIQSQILGDLEAAKKQTSINATDDINDFTSFKSAISNWKNMLSAVFHHGSDQQCLIISNEIEPKLENLQDQIKESLKNFQNVSYRFELAKCVKDFEQTVKSLGDLKIRKSKFGYKTGKLEYLPTDFQNGEIKVIRTINVASGGQSSGTFVDGSIIFTLCSDKKVVKYNQNGDFIGGVLLPNHPHDICPTTEYKVAVSNWHDSLIYLVDYKNMTLLNTINSPGISGSVHGLCNYNNNQFLVSYTSRLTWVDQSSGTKVKSVTTSGQSAFVCSSGNNDYIYGDGDNSVSYVVNDTKKFTYTNKQLSTPRGIGIDGEGNFYVAGNGSENIHQITKEGELIRIIPNTTFGGLVPWVVRFEKNSNRFLVTCRNSGKATLCAIE